MSNFLVIGPESSGTRMLTKAFIAAGCFGDSGHSQRLDRDLSLGSEPKVLRRSLPHGGVWPDVTTLASSLGATVVGIKRNEAYNAKSMQKSRQHARTESEARAKIHRAHEIIDHYADVIVQYGEFVTDADYRKEVFEGLGLPAPEMEFYDANRQYG